MGTVDPDDAAVDKVHSVAHRAFVKDYFFRKTYQRPAQLRDEVVDERVVLSLVMQQS